MFSLPPYLSDFGIVLALRSLIALLLLEEGGDQLSSDIAQSGQAAKY